MSIAPRMNDNEIYKGMSSAVANDNSLKRLCPVKLCLNSIITITAFSFSFFFRFLKLWYIEGILVLIIVRTQLLNNKIQVISSI